MDFDHIRTGDLLKYSADIKEGHTNFPDNQVWEDEPFKCTLRATRVTQHEVALECINGCDNHNITRISSEEYQEYSNILDSDLMMFTSMAAAVQDMFIMENPVYGDQEDLDELDKMLEREVLAEN